MPNNTNDTPTKTKSTTTVDFQSANLDIARAALANDIPEATEVTLDSLADAVLLLVPREKVKSVERTLVSNGSITGAGKNAKWSCLPQNLASAPQNETELFKPVEVIVKAIEAAAQLEESILNYMTDGNSAPHGSRDDRSRPDGFFYVGTEKHAAKDVAWGDIFMPQEFKKVLNLANQIDNMKKILWAMNHIMRNDARRRFVLGLTCENTTVRLWYLDRCDFMVSKSFDINKEWKKLVYIILAMLLATPDRLGYDEDIELRPNQQPDTEPSYDIRIVIPASNKKATYRTFNMLSDVKADSPIGSATRAWKVKELKKGVLSRCYYVLKDSWVHEDSTREDVIIERICKAKPGYARYFLTVHARGFASFSFAKDDNTHTTLRRMKPVQTNKVLAIRTRSKNVIPPRSPDLPRSSVGHAGHSLGPRPEGYRDFSQLSENPRLHQRIVFKEVGTPGMTYANLEIYLLRFWEGWKVCVPCIFATSGLFGRRGVIADLEYAKEIDDPRVPHEVKTGTAAFMATEVAFMKHSRLSEFRSECKRPNSLEEEELRDRRPVKSKPLPPFRHNELHDLESFWWVCVWMMLYLVPVRKKYKAQLDNFNRVFCDKTSRHRFLLSSDAFNESTTHLGKDVIALIKEWADSINNIYAISYKEQDALKPSLKRIVIGDKAIKLAYNRGKGILGRLKTAYESLSTKFVPLPEISE
ncbi:putative kinase domain protein [Rhizoctonia solani 123E]|uniref:Putative kinase domain protein n=1 Tax=Rhizoctonia solani 123E TaxID=1423351 RepID=A0A074RPD5_9AGAM|nr:putative kinase domain protein [Rhizoctonia solani 123E]